MAFFAVVSDPSEESQFKVVHCHLNIWVLPGLLGYHVLYFELGLRVRSTAEKPLASVPVALPFETREEDIQSLHEVLQQETTAELIFGTAVEMGKAAGQRTIQYAGLGAAALLDVQGKIVADRSGRDHTFVKLEFDRPLTTEEEGYFRVRFRMSRSRRLWKWNRSIFAKNGALLDLRVADRREAATVQAWRNLDPVTIPELYTFVITPSDLRMVAVSPPLYYMRLMEGGAWHRYLDRRSAFLGAGRLLIYQWRNLVIAATPEGSRWRPINLGSPFRVFLDLRRDDAVVTPKAMLRPMVALGLVAALLLWMEPSIGELRNLSPDVLKRLTIVGVVVWALSWAYRLFGHRKTIVTALKWFRSAGRGLDAAVFGGFLGKR